MSIDYRGQRRTGLLSTVTNTFNGEKYNISTARTGTNEWETTVFKGWFFGPFRPRMRVSACDERQARFVHDRAEEIVEQRNPAEWPILARTILERKPPGGTLPDPMPGNNPPPTRRKSMARERPGNNPPPTPRKSMARERQFVVLEAENGYRHLVHMEVDKDGNFTGDFTLWDKYKHYAPVIKGEKAPPLNFELFGKYKAGDRTYTMRDAKTAEIEANALGNDGKPMRYQKDGVASILAAHDYYAKLINHLKNYDEIVDSAGFKRYATTDSNDPRIETEGWQKVNAPGFEDYWMEKRLREAIEDAVQPGFNDDALNGARRLSRATQQTIFWNIAKEAMDPDALRQAIAKTSDPTHDQIVRLIATNADVARCYKSAAECLITVYANEKRVVSVFGRWAIKMDIKSAQRAGLDFYRACARAVDVVGLDSAATEAARGGAARAAELYLTSLEENLRAARTA
jgi:hypothetical protein